MTELQSAMPHRVVLTTRLSRVDVVTRLNAGVGHWMNAFTDKPVRGLVFPGWAMLSSAKWFTSHTPVRIRFVAQPGGGTRLECQAGLAIAALLVIAILIITAIVLAASAAAAHAMPLVYILPGLLILVGVGSLWSAAAMTRRSHTEVLAYVRTLLDATDEAPDVVA